jgi:uncharacterized protein (TIGR02246 family)
VPFPTSSSLLIFRVARVRYTLQEAIVTNTAQQGDVRAAIEQGGQHFMETFRRQDAAGMGALYTADGQALPPGGDIASGQAAIGAVWQGAFDAGLKEARLETLEVEGFDDTAYEVGAYTLLLDGGQVADRGKYIVIWKRVDGQWRLHRDIWNSSGSA